MVKEGSDGLRVGRMKDTGFKNCLWSDAEETVWCDRADRWRRDGAQLLPVQERRISVVPV